MTGKDILEALDCLSEEEIGEALAGEAVQEKPCGVVLQADAREAMQEKPCGVVLQADAGEAVQEKPCGVILQPEDTGKNQGKRRVGFGMKFAAAALLGVVLFGGGIAGGIALASEYGLSLKSFSSAKEQSSFLLNVAIDRISSEELGKKVLYAAQDLREEILQTPEAERKEYYGYMERFDKVADSIEYFGVASLKRAPVRWQETEAMVILLEDANGRLLRAEQTAYYKVDGNRINTMATVYTDDYSGEILAGFAPVGEYVPYKVSEYQTKSGKTAWFMTLEGEDGYIGGWFGYLLDGKILYEITIPAPSYYLPQELYSEADPRKAYQDLMWELMYEWAEEL